MVKIGPPRAQHPHPAAHQTDRRGRGTRAHQQAGARPAQRVAAAHHRRGLEPCARAAAGVGARRAARSVLRASAVNRLARVPCTIAPCERPAQAQSQELAGRVDRWHAAEHFLVPTRFGGGAATRRARFGNPCPIGRSTRLRGAFLAFGGSGFRRRGLAASAETVVAVPNPAAATIDHTPPDTTATAIHSTVVAARRAMPRFCFLDAITHSRQRGRRAPGKPPKPAGRSRPTSCPDLHRTRPQPVHWTGPGRAADQPIDGSRQPPACNQRGSGRSGTRLLGPLGRATPTRLDRAI